MITIQSSDLTENQLAEIALAIQNRWGVAAFVKMHEIAVVDDDEDFPLEGPGKDSDENFEKGFKIIMERLKMDGAFVLEKVGRSKFRLLLVDHESLPTWLEETAKPKKRFFGFAVSSSHVGRLSWSTSNSLNFERPTFSSTNAPSIFSLSIIILKPFSKFSSLSFPGPSRGKSSSSSTTAISCILTKAATPHRFCIANAISAS